MALSFSSPLTNNPMLRGSLAAPKQRFGKFGRYGIAPIHTRFNAIEWVIWDADIINEATGLAVIIRQACTMDYSTSLTKPPDRCKTKPVRSYKKINFRHFRNTTGAAT